MPRMARKIGAGCAVAAAVFVVAVVVLLFAIRFLPDNPIVAALDLESIIAALESRLTNSEWAPRLREPLEWLYEHPEALWAGVLLLAAVLAYAIVRLRRRHRRRTRQRSGLCPACGYDLRAHTASDPCPECGLRRAPSSRTPAAK